MVRLRLMALLLIALLIVTACGGGSAEQPTAAPSGGATNAPAAAQATAAPAPTAAEQPTAAAQPTAASAQPTAQSDQATTAPAAELQVDKAKLSKELHFYNWSDYIDPDILTAFEQEYGVKVIMDLYDANEDMIAKVRPGNSGYDIVVPSDYAVDIMAQEKLLAPLDKSLLPNLQNLKKQNLDLYYDKGNAVSVPYFYGISGIAYNKSKFPTPPDSWAALFDTAQIEKYKGEFSMLDDEREVPGAALHYIGKSMNDTDPADLAKAAQILEAQRPFVAAYDTSSFSRKLASGEYVLAHAYNSNALQARVGIEGDFTGNPNIGFVIPKEGGTIWQDNLCIVSDSPNQYTAHVFINYLMLPEVAVKNTQFNLGLSPNAEAEKLLDPKILELYKEGFAPDDATLKRLEWIERNDKTVVFTDLWTQVRR
jgi:spermidine/putrescine transport system substrate-binding protein